MIMKITNDTWKVQLRKGIFELLILSLLDKKTMYGYEINLAINNIPEFDIPNGTIYPILQRLTKNEWVTFYWGESDNGPRRKYYQITEEGREIFRGRVDFYDTIYNVLQQELTKG